MEPSFKTTKSPPFIKKYIPLCLWILLLQPSHSIPNHTTLLYKTCANQSSTSLSQTLSSLFKVLIQQSSTSNFFKDWAGNEDTFLSGLYQCRGDISKQDCRNCVAELEHLSNSLCAEAESARVHLEGCYVVYERDGVGEKGRNGVVEKVCGRFGGDWGERDAALAALEEGMWGSGNGFYETRSEGVEVMGQCQGDLWGCDCAECVGRAVQIAREECGGSAAGQVYLDRCYITFTSHPEKGGNSASSGKLVAVVLGVAATLGLGFVLLVFCKSCGKKDDDI